MAQVIAHARPDIIVLQGLDWDADGAALAGLAEKILAAGHDLPHSFVGTINSGQRTGHDHDGDGRTTGWADAQGFGKFTGNGAMAILSRYPADAGRAVDFSELLWADLPGARLPQTDGALFPDAALYSVQRLASVGQWAVPFQLTNDRHVTVLAFHATTPVFDGPEDRNGLRNADELRLWQLYLDGALPDHPAPTNAVIAGVANVDPEDGEGLRGEIRALLAHPRLSDPQPNSAGSTAAAAAGQAGRPGTDTVDWPEPSPGNLRVSYVLPEATFTVLGAGVIWPAPDDPFAETVQAASRHRLVWVDLEFQR